MPLVPLSMQLEGPPCLNDRKIIARSSHKLQTNGKILISESARHGHRRQPADVAQAAERIRENQTSLEIQAQWCRGNRLRGCCYDVKRFEQGIHLLLRDLPHLLRL